MPKLVKIAGGVPAYANDTFVEAVEDEPVAGGDAGVILPLERYRAEGEALLAAGRRVGVRLKSDEAVEEIEADLPRLSLVALEFPKFRDGRAFSSAALLRQRYRYPGEVRAVGEVLREQAFYMVRVGFDAFEFSDGTGPDELERTARQFRHVYQAASDGRDPIFIERQKGASNA